MTPLLARGLAVADGIVLDVGLLGEEAARRRVLDLWGKGSALLDLDEVGWLLVLSEPRTWRSQLAPGTLLQRRHGALLAWGVDSDPVPGTVVLPHHGRVLVRQLADLPPLDPATWVTLDGLTPHWLTALDVGAPEVSSLGPSEPPVVTDLRAAAGIAPMSDADAAMVRQLLGEAPAGRGPAGGGAGPGNSGAPAAWQTWVGRLRGVFNGDRRDRYLAELQMRFEQGHLDEALRRAIPLGGESTGLTNRLPRLRRELKPSRTPPKSGPSVDFGESVADRLRGLYRQAAAHLESEGRIDEAAFVLADLLRSPSEAVAMLERHGRWRLAAELADAHRLDPERRLRLWWRAGEQERALVIARRHRCFSMAIDHLQRTEPERALKMRRLWVDERRAAGDLLGTVEAAWPAPELRVTVVDDILAGLVLSGSAAPRLLAHLLSVAPQPDAIDAARVMLMAREPERARSRAALVTALGELPAADPAVDRELASEATRALLTVSADDLGIPESSRRTLVARLSKRGDPLLAADLPPSVASGRAPAPLTVEATPGASTQVLDVATLDGGLVLVARGEAGVTALRPSGQIVAHWDVPTSRLVPADHGGRALLLADRETAVEITVLDLATRRTEAVGTLRLLGVTSSYDGALWAVADETGLAIVDMAAPRPTVQWRELGPSERLANLQRSPSHLSALVHIVDPKTETLERTEAWTWALPAMTAPRRMVVPPREPGRIWALTATGHLVVETIDNTAVLGGFGRSLALPPGPVHSVLVDGDAFAVTRPRPPGSIVLVGADRLDRPLHSIEVPTQATLALRRHGATVTLWSDQGHVVALDPSTSQLVANLHMPL